MDKDLENHWTMLRDRMLNEHSDVAQGKMMSADALTHRGKVFVFFSKKGGITSLGCRVGRETDIAPLGLDDWQHLAPFKTKPPMKDWIVLGAGDLAKWMDIAALCLTLARERD